jgi:hypothetical protein
VILRRRAEADPEDINTITVDSGSTLAAPSTSHAQNMRCFGRLSYPPVGLTTSGSHATRWVPEASRAMLAQALSDTPLKHLTRAVGR